MSKTSTGAVVWKHIGLHGHSVGSFACEDERIVWKSAVTGHSSDDLDTATTTRVIPADKLSKGHWTVFGKSGYLRLQTKQPQGSTGTSSSSSSSLRHEYRFDGFPTNDFEILRETLQKKYQLELTPLSISAAGTQYGLTSVKNKSLIFRHCVLDEMNEEGQEFEPRAEDEMLSLDLAEVSQCVLPGNNRNEIELQFPESDTVEAGTDQLVSIRLYIPPDPDADPADKQASTAAELLQQKIMQTASIRKTTGDVIVSFDQNKGTFLTPRGRYAIELYDYFLRMRGQKYDYKIKYDDINRLFLLPKPDEVHMAFVIALDKPIRQGQQRYQYLVLQASKDPDEVAVNLDEESLQKDYNGELQPVMRGSLANLIAKTFKVISRKKVFIPGKFANANQQACVKCAVRANEGLLYPLEKQFVFIHKPPILIRFNEVESVEFQRYAGGQGSTRNFDLCVNLKTSVTVGSVKDYVFSGIERSDYAGLYNFISAKKIPIKNLEGTSFMDGPAAEAPVYNEDEIYGGPDDDMEEGSEDEDFDEADAAADEAGGSDDSEDIDDDELGSEVDEELDSDLEAARKKTGGGKRKKESAGKSKKSKDENDDDDDDDDEDNDNDEDSPKKKKRKKNKKDPKAPKKARSAYMLYMSEMRSKVVEENPDADFGTITKLLANQFKSLSPEERAKWDTKANADKERYNEEMADYSAPEDSDDGDGKDVKKKAKKDPKAPKRAMTAYFFFMNEQREKMKEENPEAGLTDVVCFFRLCCGCSLLALMYASHDLLLHLYNRPNFWGQNGRLLLQTKRKNMRKWPPRIRSATRMK